MRTILSVLLLILSLPNYNVQAGHDGNGGGGVIKDGRYMTFYSAGFYTEKESSELEDIPGLNELYKVLRKDLDLMIYDRVKFIDALVPSKTRKYFKVKKEYFSEEVRKRLKEAYAQTMGFPDEEFALFAVTDTSEKITYLLPEFYELTTSEQVAILFHEALWVLYPRERRIAVVNAEMSMQLYFENPTSKNALNLVKIVADWYSYIRQVPQYDLEHGYLNGLLTQDGKYIPIETLLGANFLNCREAGDTEYCYDYFLLNLYDLKKTYPNSLFLETVYEKAKVKGITWHGEYNYECSTKNEVCKGELDDVLGFNPNNKQFYNEHHYYFKIKKSSLSSVYMSFEFDKTEHGKCFKVYQKYSVKVTDRKEKRARKKQGLDPNVKSQMREIGCTNIDES